MTKVFWAFVLLAVAYGVATLLGPVEPRRFSAPIESASPIGVLAHGHTGDSAFGKGGISNTRLRLRDDQYAPVRSTQRGPHVEREARLINTAGQPTDGQGGAAMQSPPKWVSPMNRVNRTSHWTQEVSPQVALAGSEQPIQPTGQEPPASRTHIVVDGDTLPKLAQRYLDDVGRDWEIYQLNRHLLRSHELLPIGVILQLPPREPLATTSTALARIPASRLPPSGSEVSHDKLIPIRPMSASSRQFPQAQLLRPVQIDATTDSNALPVAEGQQHSESAISFVPD